MSARLYDSIAQQLQERLDRDPSFVLPSISALAQQFEVSYATMWKAVHHVSRKGLLRTRRGKGSARAGGPNESARLDLTYETLCREIEDGIVNGRYHPGRSLPKFDFFVMNHNVSRTTVAQAFAQLAEENFIHKKGRNWIVGPAPSRTRDTTRSSPQDVVIMLVPRAVDWENMVRSEFMLPFLFSLRSELLLNRTSFVVLQYLEDAPGSSLIPGGVPAVESAVRESGGRYRGAVMFENTPRPGLLRWWHKPLSAGGRRPVIFLDSTGSGQACTRSAVERSRRYYRMFLDERAAVEIALQTLAEMNHRVVGVPTIEGYGSWQHARLELVRAVAADIDPPLTVVSSHQDEPFWDFGVDATNLIKFIDFPRRFEDYIRSRRSRKTTLTDVKQRRMAATPSLASLIDQGATALLPVNDLAAYEYYRWCDAVGIRVPLDLSLITFDNSLEGCTLPVNSVDFGLSHLGYLAAHALIGDLPIRSDREGNVPGPCTLIERGSVGSARGGG